MIKKNIVTVIYPGEFRTTFEIESDKSTEQILEMIFAQWNVNEQTSELFKQSRVRSLSVNDIVIINNENYQCRYFGWVHVTPEYTKELEDTVISQSIYSRGAYFALNEIMISLENDTKNKIYMVEN